MAHGVCMYVRRYVCQKFDAINGTNLSRITLNSMIVIESPVLKTHSPGFLTEYLPVCPSIAVSASTRRNSLKHLTLTLTSQLSKRNQFVFDLRYTGDQWPCIHWFVTYFAIILLPGAQTHAHTHGRTAWKHTAFTVDWLLSRHVSVWRRRSCSHASRADVIILLLNTVHCESKNTTPNSCS